MSYESQCVKILRHLAAGQTLTARQASQMYGCDRLSARIYDIKNGKHGLPQLPIKTEMIVKGRKQFARYHAYRSEGNE